MGVGICSEIYRGRTELHMYWHTALDHVAVVAGVRHRLLSRLLGTSLPPSIVSLAVLTVLCRPKLSHPLHPNLAHLHSTL